jgi:hypothetical protein
LGVEPKNLSGQRGLSVSWFKGSWLGIAEGDVLGFSDTALVGFWLGEFDEGVGASEGPDEGDTEGLREGVLDGLNGWEGPWLGCTEGCELGACWAMLGLGLGEFDVGVSSLSPGGVGALEGPGEVLSREGLCEGSSDRAIVLGFAEGCALVSSRTLGVWLGLWLGEFDVGVSSLSPGGVGALEGLGEVLSREGLCEGSSDGAIVLGFAEGCVLVSSRTLGVWLGTFEGLWLSWSSPSDGALEGPGEGVSEGAGIQ